MTTSKYFIPQVEKPLVDPKRLSVRNRDLFNNSGVASFVGQSGLGCSPPLGPKPKRNIAAGEKVLKGPSNASITLGVDRTGGLGSGFGGQGIPSSAIDICAGHMGPYARETDDKGYPVLYNPNFPIDAARVYVAELTDIDGAMKLPEGSMGKRIGSAVGIVADNINIQAKGGGGIKIAAHPSSRDSQGKKNLENPGIDLIAGGGEDLQPIPKGQNLLELLKEMNADIDDLRGTMEQFVRLQGSFNDKIMNHDHNSPFWAKSTAPSFSLLFEGYKQAFQRVADVETGLIFNIINKENTGLNYFNPVAQKYILSGLVKVS